MQMEAKIIYVTHFKQNYIYIYAPENWMHSEIFNL